MGACVMAGVDGGGAAQTVWLARRRWVQGQGAGLGEWSHRRYGDDGCGGGGVWGAEAGGCGVRWWRCCGGHSQGRWPFKWARPFKWVLAIQIGEEEVELGRMGWRVGLGWRWEGVTVGAGEAMGGWGCAAREGWRLDGEARRWGGAAAGGPAEGSLPQVAGRGEQAGATSLSGGEDWLGRRSSLPPASTVVEGGTLLHPRPLLDWQREEAGSLSGGAAWNSGMTALFVPAEELSLFRQRYKFDWGPGLEFPGRLGPGLPVPVAWGTVTGFKLTL